jgi:hypothetical protein
MSKQARASRAWWAGEMSDVRETLRSLLRTPGFALSVIATLGLAIGANTSVFTLVDQVVFRPLPVEAPAELVRINAPMLFGSRGGPMVSSSTTVRGEGGEQVRAQGLSCENFLRFREEVKAFRDVVGFFEARATVPAGDRALEVNALLVTGSYFRVIESRVARSGGRGAALPASAPCSPCASSRPLLPWDDAPPQIRTRHDESCCGLDAATGAG